MSENKYTPGPWTASDRGDYNDFDGNSRVILGDDMRIAVVHDSGSSDGEANAHLIAAAPDQHTELSKIWSQIEDAEFDDINDDDDLVVITIPASQARAIRTVVTKVTGEARQ